MKNFKDAVAKPRKVALYANLTIDDYFCVWEVVTTDYDEHYKTLPEGQTRERPITGWVRITDPVAMEFVAVDNDSVVRHAVESLNEQERALIDEMNKKLADIRERKNQLLALTYQVEP